MTRLTITDAPDSKRMYDKRFREWNVFKNVNSDEKERVVRRVTAEPASPLTNVIDKDSISPEDLRKTIRCAKTIQQGARRSSPSGPGSPGADQVGLSYQHVYQHRDRRQHRAASRGVSISDLVQKTLPPPPAIKSPPPSEREQSPTSSSSPELVCATPTSSSAWSDDHLPVPSNASNASSNARSMSSSPVPCLSVFKAQLQKLAQTPPPTINSEAKTRSLEIITMSIRDFYDWQLQTIPKGVLPDDYLGHRSSEESKQYWSTVKNSIYLIKISSGSMGDLNNRPDARAWPALAEAGGIATAAMDTQPFDFLRNVFAILSPANTSARPELRTILLQFLATEARNRHSPNHPIARICEELQNDEDCQEVSRRALQCMLDTFNSRLGRSRAVTFKILDSLATLLRRNGEFEAAMEIVLELLSSCRQVFGKDSDEARTVENELAHFYMVADEFDRALEHCMNVVKKPDAAESPSETESVFYQDGIAAHTMEDIAEIHQRRGDIEQCITWLERAASIALNVWGHKSLATSHIVDKMTSLQRQFGKDLIRSAMVWEAAIVQ
ncbi:hypothetical protein QBC37DRAFT_419992 [Rhypophila decipiens]|uniref:Clr5 domain-containing protein n=1 Tax=Rhypophila decipiens TaxID=261697 RepID=A0AAN7B6W2_9PEZI|nr:hypothetical protein QBC37DRAFT_419992 [Rhypophila decipiens]